MDFYDDLAPLYQLIFPNWTNNIRRQGEQLDSVIQTEWSGHRTVLDVSCGIDTQTLALTGKGYSVVGSDLSTKEIERARRETGVIQQNSEPNLLDDGVVDATARRSRPHARGGRSSGKVIR